MPSWDGLEVPIIVSRAAKPHLVLQDMVSIIAGFSLFLIMLLVLYMPDRL